jgi:type II secretory pathway component PulF
MPEYYYEALESTGAVTRGTLDAESELDAAAQLAACELAPQRVTSSSPRSVELATSAEAPTSEIRETFRVLGEATLNFRLRREIRDFLAHHQVDLQPAKRVNFLSALLAHCRQIGDPLTALGPLIEFERDLTRVKTDSSGRFIYAYALLVFASCLFSATDYFIGESFRTMFREFELKLPQMTILMLNVGPLFWGMTFTLITIPLFVLVARALCWNQFAFDRGLDSILLWGPWRRWRYSAQALAYLGSSLKSGFTLPQACEVAADALPRPFNAWQLRELGRRIEAGATLEAACATAKVHSMVMPFLLASERHHELPAGCLTAARLLLERCRRRRMFFAGFIESFAMVFVMVTAIALFASYLLPLFSLITNLSK